MTTSPPPAPRPQGVIHDLGYARYAGERRPPSTLWRVIMRQHLSYSWKTRWRLKPWLLGAVGISIAVGVILYLNQNSIIGLMSEKGVGPTWIRASIPFAYEFYRVPAFMISMTIGAAVIAHDRQTGAFTFYFSRPVRPFDYVVGKLTGQFVIVAMIFLAGPTALALFSIGLSDSSSEAIEQLKIVPKVLVIGLLGTAAFASIPLAFSAVAPRRTIALTAWAGYYIVVASIVSAVGGLLWLPLRAIDPGAAMESLAMGLFDVAPPETKLAPLWAAISSLVAQSVIAIGVIMMMVKRESEGSVGGSS